MRCATRWRCLACRSTKPHAWHRPIPRISWDWATAADASKRAIAPISRYSMRICGSRRPGSTACHRTLDPAFATACVRACAAETVDLRFGQPAPRALGQAAEFDRADRHPHEPQYVMAARREHATYLPVPPFAQHDFQPAVFLAAACHAYRFGRQPFPAIDHAREQAPQRCGPGYAAYLHPIGLRDMRRRIGDAR